METFKKYFWLLVCLFFATINFNIILKPLKLVTGGTQGVAIILNYLLKIRPSLIILIINVIMLLISYFFLSKENTYSALVATFVYPLFVKITSLIPMIEGVKEIILVVIAGIVCGITGGFIYKLGFSSGGITILNLLIEKYLKIKIALIHFIVNVIIVLLGCYYFGLLKAIYSILVILIGSIIINIIMKKSN